MAAAISKDLRLMVFVVMANIASRIRIRVLQGYYSVPVRLVQVFAYRRRHRGDNLYRRSWTPIGLDADEALLEEHVEQ